jgi:hypothetical protein
MKLLHQFYIDVGGDVFGEYVQPMRDRASLEGRDGYCKLYIDIVRMAHEAMVLASNFFMHFSVPLRLADLRKIKGYGGSGFRAKEVLVDCIDNVFDMLTPDEVVIVTESYRTALVIGVGPCRSVNWLFGRPFYFNEEVRGLAKEELYEPALQYIIQWLQQHHKALYGHRTYLCICYELCEFSKALLDIYLGAGRPYKSTVGQYQADIIDSPLALTGEDLGQFCKQYFDLNTTSDEVVVEEYVFPVPA